MENSTTFLKGVYPYFEKSDIFIFLNILLICIAPKIGSFCVWGAFVINILRIFKCDIHTFMFDIMCILPFANIYKVAPKTPSLVLILIIVGVCWFILRLQSKTKVVTPVVFFTSLYLFLRSDLKFDALFTIVASLMLVCVFACRATYKDSIKVAYGYIISVSISVLVAYFAQSSNIYINYILEDIQVGNFSDALRFKGLFADPNYLSTYLLSSACILCQLLAVKKIKITYFLFLFSIIVFGGVITYSKTFFLTIIAISILAIYNLWNSKNKKWAVLFSIISFIITLYALSGAFTDINIIFDRFSHDSNLDELTTGRATLWTNYADNIFSNIATLFIGNGMGALLLGHGAHNLYLETLYFFGTLGLLLFILSFVNSFQSTINIYKTYSFADKGVAILSLLVLLVVYWSLQGIYSFATYFQFFIAILMLKLPNRDD